MPQDKDKTDVLDAKTLSATIASWTSYNWLTTSSDLRKEPKTIERSTSQEPIVGYRVWKLKDGLLQSSVMPDLWPARQRMTRDVKNDLTDNPVTGITPLDKSLGIHAANTEQAIFECVNSESYVFMQNGLWGAYKAAVAGEVYLWGEVKECQHGWLAEFAYPKRLWLPESTDVLTLMQLEQNYGVPVETRPDLSDWKPSYCMISGTMAAPIKYTVTSAPPRKAGRQYFRYDAKNNRVISQDDKMFGKGLDKQKGSV